jgi:hypothetical protein
MQAWVEIWSFHGCEGIVVFWVMPPCCLVGSYHRLCGTYCLPLQVRRWRRLVSLKHWYQPRITYFFVEGGPKRKHVFKPSRYTVRSFCPFIWESSICFSLQPIQEMWNIIADCIVQFGIFCITFFPCRLCTCYSKRSPKLQTGKVFNLWQVRVLVNLGCKVISLSNL